MLSLLALTMLIDTHNVPHSDRFIRVWGSTQSTYALRYPAQTQSPASAPLMLVFVTLGPSSPHCMCPEIRVPRAARGGRGVRPRRAPARLRARAAHALRRFLARGSGEHHEPQVVREVLKPGRAARDAQQTSTERQRDEMESSPEADRDWTSSAWQAADSGEATAEASSAAQAAR